MDEFNYSSIHKRHHISLNIYILFYRNAVHFVAREDFPNFNLFSIGLSLPSSFSVVIGMK